MHTHSKTQKTALISLTILKLKNLNQFIIKNIQQIYNIIRQQRKKIPIQKPTKPSFIEKVFQHKKAKEIQGNARKTQEERQEEIDKFCRLIASIPYMQTYGYVRAKNGEQITKDNVLSAGAIGYGLLPISKFESMKDTDPKAYRTITNQIVRFIEGSKIRFNKVNTDWF